MFGVFDALKLAVGAAAGFALCLGWAIFLYGPEQYRLGGVEKAAQLDAATERAIEEISDEADKAAYLRRQCVERDGVYDFVDGRCVEEGPQ